MRGPRTNFYENNDAGQVQTSPAAIIEDTSTSPSQDIDNKMKTLQIQSRTYEKTLNFLSFIYVLLNYAINMIFFV